MLGNDHHHKTISYIRQKEDFSQGLSFISNIGFCSFSFKAKMTREYQSNSPSVGPPSNRHNKGYQNPVANPYYHHVLPSYSALIEHP